MYIHSRILLSHKKKKKEALLFVTKWMDLEGIILRAMSQTGKDKYLWNLETEQTDKTK